MMPTAAAGQPIFTMAGNHQLLQPAATTAGGLCVQIPQFAQVVQLVPTNFMQVQLQPVTAMAPTASTNPSAYGKPAPYQPL